MFVFVGIVVLRRFFLPSFRRPAVPALSTPTSCSDTPRFNQNRNVTSNYCSDGSIVASYMFGFVGWWREYANPYAQGREVGRKKEGFHSTLKQCLAIICKNQESSQPFKNITTLPIEPCCKATTICLGEQRDGFVLGGDLKALIASYASMIDLLFWLYKIRLS